MWGGHLGGAPLPTALSKSKAMNPEALQSNSVLVSPAPVGTCEVPTQGGVVGGDTTCHTLGIGSPVPKI